MVAPMSDPSRAVGVDRRRERSRRTRQRIVETAYRLFVARGYSVPLAEVADAADVSVQNLYVAFRNKQVLVQAVLQLAVHGDDLPAPPHHRRGSSNWLPRRSHARRYITGLPTRCRSMRGSHHSQACSYRSRT